MHPSGTNRRQFRRVLLAKVWVSDWIFPEPRQRVTQVVVLVEDGHSTYIKTAARLIREWNGILGQEIAEVHPTAEIYLGKTA